MDQLEKAHIIGHAVPGMPRRILADANVDPKKYFSFISKLLNKIYLQKNNNGNEKGNNGLTSTDINDESFFSYGNYNIVGNVHEIHKIISTPGIINISKEDILYSLNSNGINFITVGMSKNGTIKTALSDAINELRQIAFFTIGKIIFNIWVNSNYTKLTMASINAAVDYINDIFEDIEIIWGVACDNFLNNGIKVTLISASKDYDSR